jgi:hypothetical protein
MNVECHRLAKGKQKNGERDRKRKKEESESTVVKLTPPTREGGLNTIGRTVATFHGTVSQRSEWQRG